MIAYNFQTQFAPQIETGSPDPKTLTLRRPRQHPARHANAGEPIGLWTGLRSKEAKRRGVGLVTVRALVSFYPHGLRAVSDLRTHTALDPVSDALLRDLEDLAGDTFARRDGFENWPALWRWHDAHRTDDEKHASKLTRELVAWFPLSAEQIAKHEAGELRFDEVA
jgi:hypothetical protein